MSVGNEAITISNIYLSSGVEEFAISSALSFPLNLSPEESIDVEVAFTAGSVNSYTGVLAIENNDGENPLIEIPLSGAGIQSDIPGCGFLNSSLRSFMD